MVDTVNHILDLGATVGPLTGMAELFLLHSSLCCSHESVTPSPQCEQSEYVESVLIFVAPVT